MQYVILHKVNRTFLCELYIVNRAHIGYNKYGEVIFCPYQKAIKKAMPAEPRKINDLKNLAVLACKVRKPEAEAFRALCEVHGLTVNAALSDYVHNSLDGCALLESLTTAEK